MTRSTMYAAGVGVLFGLLGVPMLQGEIEHAYDSLRPVAEIAAIEVGRTPTEVRYAMDVSKFRECDLVRVVAHDTTPDGTTRLTIERADGSENAILPPGHHKVGRPWIVTPVPKGKLTMYAHHQCGDRVVRTQIAVR